MTPMRFFIKVFLPFCSNCPIAGCEFVRLSPDLLPIRHNSTYLNYPLAPGSGVLGAYNDVRDKTNSDIAQVVSEPPRTGAD
jgi:hypothetical protein